jgi:hypothetical protein
MGASGIVSLPCPAFCAFTTKNGENLGEFFVFYGNSIVEIPKV